jgi:hypothetical protein
MRVLADEAFAEALAGMALRRHLSAHRIIPGFGAACH